MPMMYLAQITIPSDFLGQLLVIFLGVSASLALLINFAVKRFGIGNESMAVSVGAQKIINDGYGAKVSENSRLTYENGILRGHLIAKIKNESKIKEQVDILKRQVEALQEQVYALEKSEADNISLIKVYERQIADKNKQINKLENKLEELQ